MPFDATSLLRLYARRRLATLARQDAVAEQQRQLLRLVRRAAATEFGRDHGFSEIRSVNDYQSRVRLHSYEDMGNRTGDEGFPA